MNHKSSILHKLFRKITGKHRYSYEFNDIQYKYSDFQFYKDFCFKEDTYHEIDTLLSIYNDIDFEITNSELKKIYGRPILAVDISKSPRLKIYLYKIIINQEKQKLFFHFFENKLMLMSRVFPFVSNQRVLEFQNNYLTQYGCPKLKEKKDRLCFRDKNNKRLYLLRNLEYTEHFTKIDESFKDFIKSKCD